MKGKKFISNNFHFLLWKYIGAKAEILPLRFFYWFFGGQDMAAIWIYLIAQLFAPPPGDEKGAKIFNTLNG